VGELAKGEYQPVKVGWDIKLHNTPFVVFLKYWRMESIQAVLHLQ
jgi:hypothetical protein